MNKIQLLLKRNENSKNNNNTDDNILNISEFPEK